jgi:prolipoprotein diacylglyceryltransferase
MYPTQLLMSFLGFVIFGLLVWLRPRFRKPGHLFVFSLALFGVERFIAEFWRAGASARMFALITAVTEAQAFSLLMILFAVLYLTLAGSRRNS